VAVKESC